jgi:FtsZ-binding cell division protein ZapB
MTALQKAISTVTLIAFGGALIHEVRKVSTLISQVQDLQHDEILLREENENLARQRDEALNQLAALRERIDLINRDRAEISKLRGEVARLRSLQQDAAARPTAATEQASPVDAWEPNKAMNVGRATPQDALQTLVWTGMTTNSSELARCVVADANDPPDEGSIQNFIANPEWQGFQDFFQIQVRSQKLVSPNEVLLDIAAGVQPDAEFSRTVTLRKVNDEWKFVLFNKLNGDGTATDVAFGVQPSPAQ